MRRSSTTRTRTACSRSRARRRWRCSRRCARASTRSRPRRSRSPRRASRASPCTVARTGYTGEPGVELICPATELVALWDALIEAGAVPCGLGARDALRLEVCYPLHGNDITAGDERDRGRPRLGLRERQAVRRLGRPRAHARRGSGAQARRPAHGRGARRAAARAARSSTARRSSAWSRAARSRRRCSAASASATSRPRWPSPKPPIAVDVRGRSARRTPRASRCT